MKDSGKLFKPGVNYYSLLGVPSTASPEDITKAFRKKILQVHLDKMGPDDDTEQCYLTIEAHRILSDKALRAKYDVERTAAKDYKDQHEEFIPAGYICYDVGNQQMSRQLLDSITKWSKEFDQCSGELCDNYFPCFSQIMEHVVCDDFNTLQQKEVHYYCNVCDKKFITEAHHTDVVIKPYRSMFFSDQRGIPALKMYFEALLGTKVFNLEKRYLPSQLLGIWGLCDEWEKLKVAEADTRSLLKECDFHSLNGVKEASDLPPLTPKLSTFVEKLETQLESCSTNSAKSASHCLKESLIQNMIWVAKNKRGDNEKVSAKMSDFLIQDDIEGIICLGVSMKYIFGFQFSDWEQLGQAALSREDYELAMIWTMLAVQCGDKGKEDWLHIGIAIRVNGDNVLAHFCFLLAGFDAPEKWEELADIFTQNGDHQAAVDYHLISGSVFRLFSKSKELSKVDHETSRIYKEFFNAVRVKGLLHHLQKNCTEDLTKRFLDDIEELIEIIQEMRGDMLQGLRIFVSTWPNIFEEKFGPCIHHAAIQYLKKGAINLKSQKLILAATHFLPQVEMQLEISKLTQESSKLVQSMLELAQEANDFESLTDVLLNLNKRTLRTAEIYLEQISQPTTTSAAEKCEETEDEAKQNGSESGSSEQSNKPPGYKSAIEFLITGTIHKVKEAWLDAMCSYQNALLSAPEVMHRVLPCVSKLVQDIQFHEAVVSQVNDEVSDLQVRLRKKKYPDIDEFSSDKRRSLILTDTSPKTDYGYKDSFAKMQPDPDKMPAPPPPDEEQPELPPPPANTPMVTLDKNQEAIQTGQQDGQIGQLNAALAYVDLLKALPIQMHPGPIVMAASHFLRAMDGTDEPVELGKLYAYRNAIMMMAENLLKVDTKLQHTIHHGLTHKHMLSILLGAHEKLSKALKFSKRKNGKDESDIECALVDLFSSGNSNDDNDSDMDKAEEDDDDDGDGVEKNLSFGTSKKDLINKSEAYVIAKFFQNVVKFPKVEPLANIPSLNCSDLLYVEAMGNSFLSQFCADKVRQKHQSPLIPKHLHAYTHFIEVWKGRSTLSNFPQARLKAMEELVALKGWTMGNIQRNMMWPFITLQDDGFSPPIQCFLKLREPLKSYRTIEGFHIDYTSGTVELLFGRERLNPADTLFDLHDIRDVVSLVKAGLSRMIFSLETPGEGALSSHPFKEAKVSFSSTQQQQHNNHGANLQNKEKPWQKIPEYIQATLSRVSMLLSYFASGYELCSETPFWMRNTCEGLLSRLDDHLQHFARPIPWRRSEQTNRLPTLENDTLGKFWLNMVEVFEEIEEEEDDDDPETLLPTRKLTYHVGEIRTEIRPNTLVMTLNPKQSQQSLNPEGEFAKDFTKNFRDLSRHFPELQRLEELVKICIVCEKLKQVLLEGKALIRDYNSRNKNAQKPPPPRHDVNCLARVCSIIENFLTLQQQQKEDEGEISSSCDWFPAMFCHNLTPDVYDVTVGIELDPVVTYGPVPSHRNPYRVSLKTITNLHNGESDSVSEDDDDEDVEDGDECNEEITGESSGSGSQSISCPAEPHNNVDDDDTDCGMDECETESEQEVGEIDEENGSYDDEEEVSFVEASENQQHQQPSNACNKKVGFKNSTSKEDLENEIEEESGDENSSDEKIESCTHSLQQLQQPTTKASASDKKKSISPVEECEDEEEEEGLADEELPSQEDEEEASVSDFDENKKVEDAKQDFVKPNMTDNDERDEHSVSEHLMNGENNNNEIKIGLEEKTMKDETALSMDNKKFTRSSSNEAESRVIDRDCKSESKSKPLMNSHCEEKEEEEEESFEEDISEYEEESIAEEEDSSE